MRFATCAERRQMRDPVAVVPGDAVPRVQVLQAVRVALRDVPEALLEVEKENLRKQIANYNKGLAAHAGLCEKLMAQVKKLEK